MIKHRILGDDDFKWMQSLETIRRGEVVIDLLTDLDEAIVTPKQTKYTVRFYSSAFKKYFHLFSEGVKYINHSCDPNMILVEHRFVATKKIKPGDEITFDYTQSEENIQESFVCNCKSKDCIKIVE